jgi:multidrug efflux system outer membrane protein
MMGPNYQRPAVDTPEKWRFEEKEVKDIVNTKWWEQFNDPVLNGLVHTSLQENKDVKIAAARVEQFIGQYGTTISPDRRRWGLWKTAYKRTDRAEPT